MIFPGTPQAKALPLNTPMPNQKLIASVPQVNATGLTKTETALLSPSEKVIRQGQRTT